MQELIKSDYEKEIFPTHFEIYNVSHENIDDLKIAKILQLSKMLLLKYKKKMLTKKELEEQYFRGLDSLGQHLIATNYGACSVIVCECETYKHSDTCPIPYLKKYLKKKNVEIDRYE